MTSRSKTRGDPVCNCDPELTRRIIENLVSNAMKHTDDRRAGARGHRRFSDTACPSRFTMKGPECRRNSGPGSSSRTAPTVLRSAAGYESSGLGLAFCRLAVEAQGGAIRSRGRHATRRACSSSNFRAEKSTRQPRTIGSRALPAPDIPGQRRVLRGTERTPGMRMCSMSANDFEPSESAWRMRHSDVAVTVFREPVVTDRCA